MARDCFLGGLLSLQRLSSSFALSILEVIAILNPKNVVVAIVVVCCSFALVSLLLKNCCIINCNIPLILSFKIMLWMLNMIFAFVWIIFAILTQQRDMFLSAFTYLSTMGIVTLYCIRYKNYIFFETFNLIVSNIVFLFGPISDGGIAISGGGYLYLHLISLQSAMFHPLRKSIVWLMAHLTSVLIVMCHEMFVVQQLTTQQLTLFVHNNISITIILFLSTRLYSTCLDEQIALSESLLCEIIPPSVASRLKLGECNIVEQYDDVTILFAKIVGVASPPSSLSSPTTTKRKKLQKGNARTMPPPTATTGEDLFGAFLCGTFLRDIFTEFDDIVERRKLNKIKTIGETYMVVGGIDDNSPFDHAKQVMLTALEFQQALKRVNASHNTNMEMRMGAHTGPVIGGVLGLKKFAYGKWGGVIACSRFIIRSEQFYCG